MNRRCDRIHRIDLRDSALFFSLLTFKVLSLLYVFNCFETICFVYNFLLSSFVHRTNTFSMYAHRTYILRFHNKLFLYISFKSYIFTRFFSLSFWLYRSSVQRFLCCAYDMVWFVFFFIFFSQHFQREVIYLECVKHFKPKFYSTDIAKRGKPSLSFFDSLS